MGDLAGMGYRDRQFSRIYTRAIRQLGLVKILQPVKMPGAPGICVCLRGGARQFERRRGKADRRSKEGEKKRMEKEIEGRESYSCVFIYSYVLFTSVLQRSALLLGRQTAEGKTCGRHRFRQRGCTVQTLKHTHTHTLMTHR